ncbi:MAG: protein-L-isoaspartate(D-aspartate) O-methyltransferase [Bacteroidales bacterium]|nr:protein-L-isoaspartate(D-aspartate) O-methyltransferase [Bacteroidales bacterium]
MKVLLIFLMVVSTGCVSQNNSAMDFTEERHKMVDEQIKSRGISDSRVLQAMMTVPRHRFVPESLILKAYKDTPLPIGLNQTISQPYIVAFMTEALRLKATDRVLEIGTGSGYQAAVLAEICDSVYTIDIFETLTDRAGKTLDQLGYRNIMIKHGDGYLGWTEHAPFDAIMVTCAPTRIPKPLRDQLAEGGRMIIPVGYSDMQQLILLVKKKGRIEEEAVLPVMFVPMIDEEGKSY